MSKKYYVAVITGVGYGCDYTIGCNINVKYFTTEGNETVEDNVKEICDYYGRDQIEKVEVFEYTNLERFTDFDALFAEEIEEAEREAEEEQRKADEAEFQRLAKKLGKDRE